MVDDSRRRRDVARKLYIDLLFRNITRIFRLALFSRSTVGGTIVRLVASTDMLGKDT